MDQGFFDSFVSFSLVIYFAGYSGSAERGVAIRLMSRAPIGRARRGDRRSLSEIGFRPYLNFSRGKIGATPPVEPATTSSSSAVSGVISFSASIIHHNSSAWLGLTQAVTGRERVQRNAILASS